MADRSDITEFCADGSLFAHSNKDGCLRLWDAQNSSLSQEYIPTSHLTATTTCLAWRRPRSKGSVSDVEPATSGADLLALGTCTGSVLVYCSRQARVQRQWEGRHAGAVRGVVWSGARRLLTCGDDGHVVQSSLKNDQVTLKFRASRSPVLSLCLLADGDSLLTGSRTVSWWRLSTQTLLRSFSGHSGDVTLLRAVPAASHASSQYFLSGSSAERTISAWLLCEGDGQQQNAASACFSLLAEPAHVHVCDVSTDDGDNCSTQLAVTTVTGLVHVFSTRLNGVMRKPVKPRLTLQLVSNAEPPRPLPLLACRLQPSPSSGALLIAVCYGSLLLPTFEAMRFDSDTPSSQCLVRSDRSLTTTMPTTGAPEHVLSRAPAEAPHVQQLAPGFMAPPTAARKRRLSHPPAGDTDDASVPMERRLSSLSLKQRRMSVASREKSRSGGMAQLLVQGLQGGDRQMLRTVLNNGEENVVRDTVDALPTDTLLPLISKLAHLLRFSDDGRVCMNWLRAIMQRHAAFFLAQPDLQSVFAPIYSSLQARVRHLPRLLQLRGRLQLLSAQLDSRSSSCVPDQSAGDDLWDSSAALQYQDDSTDDERFGLPSSGDEDDDGGDEVDGFDDEDDGEALVDALDDEMDASDEEMSEGDEGSHEDEIDGEDEENDDDEEDLLSD